MDAKEILPKFKKVQYAFTANMRDATQSAPNDVEPRRLAVYQELLFNNVNEILKQGFPVLHSILEEQQWDNMVRDYFATHQAKTPLFYKIPEEFLAYLQYERHVASDPAFLLELAHYEWMELVAELADDKIDESGYEREGYLLKGKPVLSPFVWLLQYQFPVHQIGKNYQPDTMPENSTLLVVYRTLQDKVKFMELNQVAGQLIAYLRDKPELTGYEILQTIAEELQHPNPETVITAGHELLQEYLDEDIILGVR